jgi:hypothetical protein
MSARSFMPPRAPAPCAQDGPCVILTAFDFDSSLRGGAADEAIQDLHATLDCFRLAALGVAMTNVSHIGHGPMPLPSFAPETRGPDRLGNSFADAAPGANHAATIISGRPCGHTRGLRTYNSGCRARAARSNTAALKARHRHGIAPIESHRSPDGAERNPG